MENCGVNSSLTKQGILCPPYFDSVYCWPAASPDTIVKIKCSEIFKFAGHEQDTIHHLEHEYFAYRKCLSDGQWDWNGWTNYSQCLTLLNLQGENETSLNQISHVLSFLVLICSLFSFVSLVIALIIFAIYRSLQCQRIHIHKNLCISLLFHCIILIIISLPVVLDYNQTKIHEIDWVCKCLKWLNIYTTLSSINWMFLEGFLLHTELMSFDNGNRRWHKSKLLHHAIGWLLPALFTGIWSLSVEMSGLTKSCWKGYATSKTIWIVTGPMLLALIMNFIFLLSIIRILITKLKNSRDKATLKAIKATALLIPLLGVEHLIFCFNPSSSNLSLQGVYLILNGFFKSIQGLAFSILYCFANSQIQTAIIKSWKRRHQFADGIKNHKNNNKHKESLIPKTENL